MKRLTWFVVALALVAGACGSAERTPPAAQQQQAAQEFPVDIDAANGTVSIPQRPQRIVSLSPTATEILFTIDAGEQVEAVDDQSNYPGHAPTTDLSGVEPNIEAIAAYEPDLVVVSNDLNDVVKGLEKLDVPVLLQPAAQVLDDTYAQIEQLGDATGHPAEAEQLVVDMHAELDDIVASVPDLGEPATYYHELDPTLFTATSDTFIGQVYGLFELENIADEAKGAGSGYPQLSAEYIVDADPDLIFLADTNCCKIDAKQVARRPGWSNMTAVRNGNVIEVDDDVASRWGPRVVEFARTVANALEELESS